MQLSLGPVLLAQQGDSPCSINPHRYKLLE
jgi:hypothetical protein